jgi:hypothetical protein
LYSLIGKERPNVDTLMLAGGRWQRIAVLVWKSLRDVKALVPTGGLAMSFDRSDSSVEERADHRSPIVRSTDQAPDMPQARRLVEASDATDIAKETPGRLPTAAERTEADRRARLAAEKAYAAWNRPGKPKAEAAAKAETPQRTDTAGLTPEASEREPVDGGLPARTADEPAANEEGLRRRVSELEADKAGRDQQLVAQDAKLAAQAKTIAEQDKRIDRLQADLGRITVAVSELRKKQDEPRPSADIAERAGGGEAERTEWGEGQHKRRLPSDAVNNVISIATGSAVTEFAYHVRDLSPESAGVAASGIALGAGMIAVWRERRKAKDDADHRPKG